MSKLGLNLYASSVDNSWPGLVALRPAAIVAIDPYHLPPVTGAGCTWVWRPWVPGTMRDWTPDGWLYKVYHEWDSKGRPAFDAVQFLNEPNLPEESGYPDTTAALRQTIAWGQALLPLLRRAWPQARLHSPPLSPNAPGWAEFYRGLAPLVDQCDVLSVHTYLDQPESYRIARALYPDKRLVISECGDRGRGTAEYGRRLLAWVDGLPDYVEWAACFCYNSTNGQFPEWEIAGTSCERVLIEEG